MGENKRRDWISEKMDKAFKESLSEKDYQVVMGLSKWYAPYFTGESKNSDSFLIRLERWRGRKANENEIKSVQSSGWDVN